MGVEPSGSSSAVTILCNTHCRWDAERSLTLTIVELLPHRIIARFRGEDPLVPWLLARAEMTAVDEPAAVSRNCTRSAGIGTWRI